MHNVHASIHVLAVHIRVTPMLLTSYSQIPYSWMPVFRTLLACINFIPHHCFLKCVQCAVVWGEKEYIYESASHDIVYSVWKPFKNYCVWIELLHFIHGGKCHGDAFYMELIVHTRSSSNGIFSFPVVATVQVCSMINISFVFICRKALSL